MKYISLPFKGLRTKSDQQYLLFADFYYVVFLIHVIKVIRASFFCNIRQITRICRLRTYLLLTKSTFTAQKAIFFSFFTIVKDFQPMSFIYIYLYIYMSEVSVL